MIKAPGALCDQCPLQDAVFVPSSGSLDASIIVLGESPGVEEMKQGRPFVGPSGRLLDAALQSAGHDPADTYRLNVVSCARLGNWEPGGEEVSCCRGRLIRELEACKSSKILTLGKIAKNSLLDDTDERGSWYSWGDKFVLPTWHPAYVLRKPSEGTTMLKDIAKAVSKEDKPVWRWPEVRVVTNLAELLRELARCPERAAVSFDIEADNVNWYAKNGESADAVLCLGLCWSDAYGVVMSDEMLYDTPGVIQNLQLFFGRDDLTFVTQNGKFDIVFLRHTFGLFARSDFDTMLAHYILDENSEHGLKAMAADILNAPDYEKDLIKQYLHSKNDSYSKIPTEELMKYCVADVYSTRLLYFVFKAQLIANHQWTWPFMNIIMPAQAKFVEMELRGAKVDIEHLKMWDARLEQEIEELTAQARGICGLSDLNMNSPAQLAEVIYDQLGLPPPPDRRIKPRSTSHEAVEHLRGKHQFITTLMQYRKVAKMKSSYIENLLESADSIGRVHMTVLIHGTEIGRLSMRNPALQTVPRATEKEPYGAAVRSSFISEEGKLLVIGDYSQAELRVLAALSEDPFLLKVYQDERDLHTEVAVAMFGSNWTKEQRVMCKMFNFAYAYGGNEHSFANDAGLPLSVAIEFVRRYDQNMPVAKQWKVDQFKLMKAQGYVQTVFGRRRRFPLITQMNADDARKSSVHAPIAGTASDLTLLSLIEAENKGIPCVLTVHDSIMAEVGERWAEEAAHELTHIMTCVADEHVPQVRWKADSETGSRWVPTPEELT